MIDWINLGGNVLWILGMALGLATLSHALWQAKYSNSSFKTILGSRGTQVYGSLAEILFCFGLALTTDSWLERGLWILLSVLALGQLILGSRNKG